MNIELSSFALLILWVLLCYLIGTIQIGDIVSRKRNIKIRELGTKNPGASNIYDKLGPKYKEKHDVKFYGMSSDTAMIKHSGGVATYRSSEG